MGLNMLEYNNPHYNLFRASAEPSDILKDLLEDKRSVNTRHAYQKDLNDFFKYSVGLLPTPEVVAMFLLLHRHEAVQIVLKYRQHLYSKGLKASTINRRIAAVKALVNYARKIGKCDYDLRDIQSDKVQPYRDTTGLPPHQIKLLMQLPDRATFSGLRDYAILRLLWDNALRRGEIARLNIGDVNLSDRLLWIQGKGRMDKERVTISRPTVKALQDYLYRRQETDIKQPLFISISTANWGKRLSTQSIYNLVRRLTEDAGIDKVMSPHRVRHSSITRALDKSGGDIRRVQKLSRHKDLNTLCIYDDNRQDLQGQITDLLADDF